MHLIGIKHTIQDINGCIVHTITETKNLLVKKIWNYVQCNPEVLLFFECVLYNFIFFSTKNRSICVTKWIPFIFRTRSRHEFLQHQYAIFFWYNFYSSSSDECSLIELPHTIQIQLFGRKLVFNPLQFYRSRHSYVQWLNDCHHECPWNSNTISSARKIAENIETDQSLDFLKSHLKVYVETNCMWIKSKS